jgi:hypothetical protein
MEKNPDIRTMRSLFKDLASANAFEPGSCLAPSRNRFAPAGERCGLLPMGKQSRASFQEPEQNSHPPFNF